MSNLTPVSLNTISAAERAKMDGALKEFQKKHPGMNVTEVPFRDSSGTLALIHYVRVPQGGMVGRALRQPNGDFEVE